MSCKFFHAATGICQLSDLYCVLAGTPSFCHRVVDTNLARELLRIEKMNHGARSRVLIHLADDTAAFSATQISCVDFKSSTMIVFLDDKKPVLIPVKMIREIWDGGNLTYARK